MRGRLYRTILQLILVAIAIIGSGCFKKIAGGYMVTDRNVVYYHGMKGMYTMRSNVVEGADPESFEALNRLYGRDKNHAYFKGKRVDASDGPSFKLIETQYSIDKNHVYYSGVILSDRPGSFEILFKTKENTTENTFATDGESIFKGKTAFFPKLVDIPTFTQVGKSIYLKDKNRVYTLNRVIEGADPATFEVSKRFAGRYSKDANNIFYSGVLVKGIDKSTHEIIDNVHHRDKSRIYFEMNILSDDPANFEILSKAYSRDSKFAFWRGKKVSDDAANFVIFPSDRAEAYARDSENAFWGWKKIDGADVETFVGLDRRYAKDKNKVYFCLNVLSRPAEVEGADPETFVIVKGEKRVDARDKNKPYYLGTQSRYPE